MHIMIGTKQKELPLCQDTASQNHSATAMVLCLNITKRCCTVVIESQLQSTK